MSTTRRNAAVFLALLFVVGGIAYSIGGFKWLELVAEAGTAVGTLGLAFYTYDLATATRKAEAQTEELVKSGQAQADAARQQIELSQAQAEAAREQIEISQQQTAIARDTATEAARARIDASAPLVAMTAYDTGFWLTDARELFDEQWPEAELKDLIIETGIGFTLTNYGISPALVAFPSWLLGEPEKLLQHSGGSRQIVLQPGEKYQDRIPLIIRGTELVKPMWVELNYTYNGFLHGAMFDSVRWNGWLQVMRLEGEIVRRNDQIPLNAAPAQIVREYPALERPEEMHELRERIRLGQPRDGETAA